MRRLLFRNLWWKLAALAASCLLWIAINGANDRAASVSVPVQYRNIAPDPISATIWPNRCT